MTFRKDTSEGRWACTKGERYFHKSWSFCLENNFENALTDIKAIIGLAVFTCYDQFLCMAFAQLTYRDSLRDTILCLRAIHKKLHHVGIQGRVSRSTLAEANEKRDWRIYCDFAQVLIAQARKLYVDEDFGDQRQLFFSFALTQVKSNFQKSVAS